jgi:hypothetical protein
MTNTATAAAHTIDIYELDMHFGQAFRAECSCGWEGTALTGPTAVKAALDEGDAHRS